MYVGVFGVRVATTITVCPDATEAEAYRNKPLPLPNDDRRNTLHRRASAALCRGMPIIKPMTFYLTQRGKLPILEAFGEATSFELSGDNSSTRRRRGCNIEQEFSCRIISTLASKAANPDSLLPTTRFLIAGDELICLYFDGDEEGIKLKYAFSYS